MNIRKKRPIDIIVTADQIKRNLKFHHSSEYDIEKLGKYILQMLNDFRHMSKGGYYSMFGTVPVADIKGFDLSGKWQANLINEFEKKGFKCGIEKKFSWFRFVYVINLSVDIDNG